MIPNFLDLSHINCLDSFLIALTGWTSLVIVNLANNKLFGKIPSSIGSLYQLETFDLCNNNFSGEIPWSLGNCSALQFVDLSYNRFSGIIPAWIGERLRSLAFLLLRSNDFNGDVPFQLCWLTNIMLLDLSNNNLSESIPSYIDKASVMWKGMECDYGDGQLPWSMSHLNFLNTLNLSYNNFSGRIPLSTQMQTFDASAFVDNPELCGLPLRPTCLEEEKSKSKPTDCGGKDNKRRRSRILEIV
ncbi:hypothetical protein SLEP1_g52958 [Rubroshorea leprosula]|uniref:Uncharacterized protein n=1 Tax=Rubroshorea leprosula TaxID=152421 RepID=A0AAV5M908_9ROSI|nr:hypothetical protein SLEP1_g52958 [Rubroshorea leprosula]